MTGKRILIVDDARDVGRMYQQALRTAYPQVAVTYVPSAEEAMVEVSAYRVDLMVVDIRLPGMSGFELVKRVHARQPGIKFLMITGLEIDAALEAQSREVGAYAILGKPLSVAAFLDAVQQALEVESFTLVEASSPVGEHGDEEGKASPLPSPIPPAPTEIPSPPAALTLSEMLAQLRASLGAMAVLLLDDVGHVTAQAGNGEAAARIEGLAGDLMAGLSIVHKLSRQLGSTLPEAVQALRGAEGDLVVAPVGRFALALYLPSGPGSVRLALAFEEVRLAQKEAARILTEMGLNLNPLVSDLPARVEEEESPPSTAGDIPSSEDVEKLKALLEGATSFQAEDVEAFWKQEIPEPPPPQASDVLSFEEARKLGLLPDEE
ncbi:MAG TPA: response regulator [Anaerolinea thermolimosa]|uniref:Response regulator n=1 Tax=Anaerolinea thermolimosa TaxID=229919 RepID=A0A3D1JJW3_9CHLR|nr:response regulator [Anaerolinea thermolimosa]GAP07694.1 response regulator containing CheY-like receiver, AAA-type ATPase, and DNA-binding domains [Anaerolinea thermolimosa]HCE17916.1 response regulator [Anaerolinea thermolimosa]